MHMRSPDMSALSGPAGLSHIWRQVMTVSIHVVTPPFAEPCILSKTTLLVQKLKMRDQPTD